MTTVLITGANRGLGLEFVKQYAGEGARVHACCRAPDKADDLKAVSGDIVLHELDVTDFDAVKALGKDINEPLDIVVVNAGYGTRGEGEFGDLDYDVWRRFLDVNLYGAVATAEAFAPHAQKAKGKIAFISSKMGSISDTSGGAMAYRTSKTAINMASKVVADALSNCGVAVGVFHPGWVATDMGGPSALIEPPESVSGLRRQIEKMKAGAPLRFVDYQGKEIGW